MRTTRTYDALGRVLSSTSACGTNEVVSWTYDSGTSGNFGIGRPATMVDPSGSTSYAYDRRGALRLEDRTIGTWSSSTAYAYDAEGNRTKMGDLEYSFDYAGRALTAGRRSCTSCALTPLVTSATYLPFGPEAELQFANGTKQTKSYDLRYRINANKLTGPGAVSIVDHGYTTDGVGNITAIQDNRDASYNRSFGYDDLNRLTSAGTGASLWGTGSFVYDRMGNPLTTQVGAHTESFTYVGTTPKIDTATEQGWGVIRLPSLHLRR